MASYQSAPSSRILALTLLAAASLAACGDEAGPAAPKLFIYGPGGYKFSDYVRFGGPLNLLVMAITVLLAPLIWRF
jgi:di/tricarboxylate transporter